MTRDIRPPAEAPNRRGASGPLTLLPLAAVAVVVAVGAIWLGGRQGGVAATSPSPVPSVVTAEASPAQSVVPAQSSPSVAPSPSPTASPAPSNECDLQAAITAWEGAAGSRIATIQLTNAGPLACSIPALPSARLIDGSGRVLAQIVNPDTGATIALAVGDIVTTDASVSNVCGQPPTPPVTIQLDLGAHGVVTARPLSPTDATVPPCNGPTQPSEMSIHPWSK